MKNYQWVDPKTLKPHPKNPNKHSPEQIERIAKLIDAYGWRHPIIVSNQTGFVIVGHGRLESAIKKKITKVPVEYQDFKDEDEEYGFMVADNAIADWADLDLGAINLELPNLGPDFDIEILGLKHFQIEPADKYDAKTGILQEKFGIPPFSVFDTRQEYWHKRKSYWLEKGFKSYTGRPAANSMIDATKRMGGASESLKQISTDAGVSIFDPFLAEILYSWFCPPKGKVVDPFSGGSVRGLICEWLGREYHGIDLSQAQIDANIKEAKRFDLKPNWYRGDSLNLDSIIDYSIKADFIFSCPPYGNLEVYSDDTKDLSNMSLDQFLQSYKKIIRLVCSRLNDDRFACFVVGDYRDDNGHYCNFVSETIDAFLTCGLKLYNEIILVNEPGTAALRANRQFSAAKKVVKTHQNVLVFIKGDAKKASENVGIIDFNDGPLRLSDDVIL